MKEKVRPQQELAVNFPKSLSDLKLPTPEEANQAVREGDKMIEQMREQRKGKLMTFDKEMDSIVVGPQFLKNQSLQFQ